MELADGPSRVRARLRAHVAANFANFRGLTTNARHCQVCQLPLGGNPTRGRGP
jgi:hypothetical protein